MSWLVVLAVWAAHATLVYYLRWHAAQPRPRRWVCPDQCRFCRRYLQPMDMELARIGCRSALMYVDRIYSSVVLEGVLLRGIVDRPGAPPARVSYVRHRYHPRSKATPGRWSKQPVPDPGLPRIHPVYWYGWRQFLRNIDVRITPEAAARAREERA